MGAVPVNGRIRERKSEYIIVTEVMIRVKMPRNMDVRLLRCSKGKIATATTIDDTTEMFIIAESKASFKLSYPGVKITLKPCPPCSLINHSSSGRNSTRATKTAPAIVRIALENVIRAVEVI